MTAMIPMNLWNRWRACFALAGLIPALPASAWADLVVVEDRGGTSALPYYQALAPQAEPEDQKIDPQLAVFSLPARAFSETDMLPVVSSRLSPGKVEGRAIQAPGLQPVFLIGADSLSREWLLARREVLQRLNAVGLVVDVASLEELKALRRLAEGLPLAPASGDDLAARLGLSRYPVLITATSIEQ